VERALDLVAAHYAEGRRPAIRMTVSPAAAAHLAENVAHYLDRGFDYIVLGPVVEAAWDEAALAALREGLAAVGARLAADLRARRPFPPVFLPLGTMLRACRLRDLGEPLGRRGCGAGVSLVAMDVEGALYPCHRFVFYDRRGPSRHRLGHLGEGARHERAPYDRPHREGELPQCAACVARGVCEYFCVAVSYAQEGRIDAIPESVCRLQRVSAEVALALHGELAGEPRYVSHLASLSGRASEATLRLLEEGRRDPGRLAEAALERLARLRRPGCGGRDERVPPPEVEA
jgi:radical SAM protein with 4Fe4S-binding SPASM domain